MRFKERSPAHMIKSLIHMKRFSFANL